MPRDNRASASRQLVMAFLRDEIGVGNTFTMTQLRQCYPGINQIDRRMRDLRPAGWIIDSCQSDTSLPLNTYRLVRIGGDKMPATVSGRTRREVFEAAGNRCQVCGIGAGEQYADEPGKVCRLQIGHWVPMDQGGHHTSRGNLRAECQRCNEAMRNSQGAFTTSQSVLTRASNLGRSARSELIQWMSQGRRDQSEAERLWYEWRQLPPSEQDIVRAELDRRTGGNEQH
jgi:hypothetical protein